MHTNTDETTPAKTEQWSQTRTRCYKWASTSSIHAGLRILPLALRVEVFQANMINKFLLNQNHPLREHLSPELHSPRPRNGKHKLTWLSTICRSHMKLAPYIAGEENVPPPPPWCQLPCNIDINDHLPPKNNTEPSVLYYLTVVTMADIILPRDQVYLTDSSVSGGLVSAAFTYLGHPTLLQPSDNASIMQEELTAIHVALLHGVQSSSRCVVFSYSKSGLQALLQYQPSYNINIIREIRDVASRMETPPLLAWIPSHIGIEGNEIADRAVIQAMMKPNIDTYLSMSKASTRRNIKQTARDICETLEQLNPTRSVYLHQHITLSASDSKALFNLTCRTDQRAIFRFETSCAPTSRSDTRTRRPSPL